MSLLHLLSIYLYLHRVPKDVGSMNEISPSVPILSIPISLEEGAASNDIIVSSLPWSSMSVGTRDHFHKNAFGKTQVAHSAYMTKPGQLWFSDESKDPLGFKACGMGPWLVLVSPCFRENFVATCKIGSFLCNLDNLLQKNVIVFFFGNQISKWRLFEKKGYFWPTFHIF